MTPEPGRSHMLPATLAQLPRFIAQRYGQSRLVGRCVSDSRAGESEAERGVTWMTGSELFDSVGAVGLGLISLGIAPGDRVAILAESRPEWLVCDFGILAAGGVSTPLYPTLAADQIAFVLRDSEAKVVCCSNRHQADKVLSVAPAVPSLSAIVVIDPTEGTPHPANIPVMTLAALQALGRQRTEEPADRLRLFDEAVSRVRPADLAMLIYTSGTTGEPKGVMLTHHNLMSNLGGICDILALSKEDVALSFLPLCHTFERMVASVYLVYGTQVVFAESTDTIARDLLRVRPTVMTGVPRVFEKLQARILERGAALPSMQRRLFTWAMGIARRRGEVLPEGGRLSLGMRVSSAVAERLVFRRVREGLGGRFRFAVSGSAPLMESVGRFFFGLGLPILEGYGLTETSPVLTVMPASRVRFGTVGVALPNVELAIADDGEILAKGPNVMAGYYRRPEATAAVLTDGWLKTGDVGRIDQDGYLAITDRKKEILVTSGGKNIAPQPIESLLRSDALVSEAIVVGDGRHFPAVLIVPDFAALATRLGGGVVADVGSRPALIARDDVQQAYARLIDSVNEGLARFEQIKAFRLLPNEFTAESGELTPTLKVKRRVVEQRYAELISSIYAESSAPSPSGRVGSM